MKSPAREAQRAQLEHQLALVHAGEITFDRCVHKTRFEWERIAVHLCRRWHPPAWIQPEADVLQELLIAAWRWIWKWDRYTSGASIGRFVVWNAMTEAKREIHRARGAVLHGAAGKNPSRYERPFSSLVAASADASEDANFIENLLRVEAVHEERLTERSQREEAIGEAVREAEFYRPVNTRQRIALHAVAMAGTLDGAAILLYEDKAMRSTLGISGLADAERMVRDSVQVVAGCADADAEF